MQTKTIRSKKRSFATEEYRKSEYFNRNKEIWKYRFIENWSLKKISGYFCISIEEVKEAIAKHKVYFQEEYD